MSLSQCAESRGVYGLPWLTGLLVLTAVGLSLAFGPAPPALVFDRAAIAQGEWWRLVTGHLLHSDGEHALWDITALALIGWVMERHGRWPMILAAAAGMAAVDAGLWWWLPGLERYCGLSGMLNTLFIIALANLWEEHRHPVIPLVVLGLAAKLAIEITVRQSLFVHTPWSSVPEAHVAGCIGAIIFLGVERLFLRPRNIGGHEAQTTQPANY
ncbi:MAG: rhombosortase [Thiobacillus sp.]|nr:rhombosortase [Thiobacillus sp.]